MPPIHKTSIPEILIPAGAVWHLFWTPTCDNDAMSTNLCAWLKLCLLPSRAWQLAATCPTAAVPVLKAIQTVWATSSPMIWSNHYISPFQHLLHPLPENTWLLIPQVTNRKKQGFHSPQNLEHPFDQTNPSIRQIGAGRTVKLWIGDATKHPHIQLRMRNVRLPNKEPYMLNRSQERL